MTQDRIVRNPKHAATAVHMTTAGATPFGLGTGPMARQERNRPAHSHRIASMPSGQPPSRDTGNRPSGEARTIPLSSAQKAR